MPHSDFDVVTGPTVSPRQPPQDARPVATAPAAPPAAAAPEVPSAPPARAD